ncbi:hypothetical protein ACK8HX_00035 [Oryzobacter sp. R7]|uniref:hypothetical protein n=1 Tax=Oryzobacter faecalis TaxID=3388656 RepID=UPI00398D218E
MDAGIAEVDEAGFVSMPTVRPKIPAGRYALFSKSGPGVAINLEYLIQVGAVAELILDHGWPANQIEFERGPFDALGLSGDGRVELAVEAKARVAGPDSLQGLLSHWVSATNRPAADLASTSGRKLAELMRLCRSGPITVWLVADSARWPLLATYVDEQLIVRPSQAPTWGRPPT